MSETMATKELRYRHFIVKVYGWMFVRPRRWFFHRMVCASYPRWKIKKEDYFGWTFPNIHWYVLYITVFNFFTWIHYDGWRPFCNWEGGYRRTYPLIARIIHKIGSTTAGYAISGGECFHCGSEEGNPSELADDESGTTFKLKETWSIGTQEGTDHRFCGTTICPNCGHEGYYEDGSL